MFIVHYEIGGYKKRKIQGRTAGRYSHRSAGDFHSRWLRRFHDSQTCETDRVFAREHVSLFQEQDRTFRLLGGREFCRFAGCTPTARGYDTRGSGTAAKTKSPHLCQIWVRASESLPVFVLVAAGFAATPTQAARGLPESAPKSAALHSKQAV